MLLRTIILSILFTGFANAQSLEGIFDIHAHADPDKTERSIDVMELEKMYKDRGFRGFVIMNHYDPTAGLAYLVHKQYPELEVYGGIVLNHLIGGMNKHAVEHFIRIEGGYGKAQNMRLGLAIILTGLLSPSQRMGNYYLKFWKCWT